MSKEMVLRDMAAAGIPAAQYIRMSTEHQRYSPDNQKAVIAAYALDRGFDIVETYQDSGKSGLTLKGRDELKRLLSDVISGEANYGAILVLDVSRWGRFQDTDQAAHYEFMCRAAGVSIHYCAEPFDSEGGMVASIVKHMKRVMAAEYSRELSSKIARAQRLQARLGFKQGTAPPYGLRRQVIDENGVPRFVLKTGERKALATDKVVFVRGPDHEAEIIAQVFYNFVRKRMNLGQIADWLNQQGERHPNGNLWHTQPVRTLLTNQLYIGYYVFGRTRNNLQKNEPRAKDTDFSRVRVVDPIIPEKLFDAAQRRLALVTRRHWSTQEIHAGLQKLLKAEGRLSYDLIEVCPYLPRACVVSDRFGGLGKAFQTVGYEIPPRVRKNRNGLPYTDEELLEELLRIYRGHGYISRHLIDLDPECPTGRYYIRRFGGLIPAFRLAGIDADANSQRRAATARRHAFQDANGLPKARPPKRGVPDAEMIDGLRRLLATHGYLSMQLINADPDLPAVGTIARRFGGLVSIYEQVGYSSSRSEIMRAARKRLGMPVLAIQRGRSPKRKG
ncbi:recombinase family protein [Sphingopyxis sp. OPL5]|uniref:recombinase family protein n=1 Tax=Sphingopyxis sp. OPL5 TaxID=2486273 RepID=UPI00164E6C47|nr:recombinase family protein [Sphingopyxis sp. OPL5]QNO26711.1 recombinase family protein [Sphingopyxis sp. OPL5]